MHQEYKIEDEDNFIFSNQISSKLFNHLIDNQPSEILKMDRTKILKSEMSKTFKMDNYYKLALSEKRKASNSYLKDIQNAIQNRLFQAETHKKIRPSQNQSENSELIVTRKNQNIFMRIFTGTFYNKPSRNIEGTRLKNNKNKMIESKDMSYFIENEVDIEDLEEWKYENFVKKINEKVTNELAYKKSKEYHEEFYYIIVFILIKIG